MMFQKILKQFSFLYLRITIFIYKLCKIILNLPQNEIYMTDSSTGCYAYISSNPVSKELVESLFPRIILNILMQT